MKFYELMFKSKGEAMKSVKVSRRNMLKMGLVGAGALALGATNAAAAISAKCEGGPWAKSRRVA